MKLSSIIRCTMIFFSFFLVAQAGAQNEKHEKKMKKKYLHDESYYEMFPHKVTGRLFVGQKSTHFYIPASTAIRDINYEANHKLAFGIGATCHNYSLNLSYGFSGVNNNTNQKGKTKGLDFQFHLYPHKWAVDLMLVMPKGMYIDPKGYGNTDASKFYFRTDVKERLWGVAAYRVPNKEKFSYRAAIVQNEWQKKSAGSVLYGGELYYGIIEGDSALVPKSIQTGYTQAGITEMRYLSIGPGLGYAYTAVMNQHIYFMVSLIGNVKLNMATEESPSGNKKTSSVAPSAILKTGIGYNSNNWSFGASLTGNALWVKGATTSNSYYMQAGAFRVQIAKKFDMHRKKA